MLPAGISQFARSTESGTQLNLCPDQALAYHFRVVGIDSLLAIAGDIHNLLWVINDVVSFAACALVGVAICLNLQDYGAIVARSPLGRFDG